MVLNIKLPLIYYDYTGGSPYNTFFFLLFWVRHNCWNAPLHYLHVSWKLFIFCVASYSFTKVCMLHGLTVAPAWALVCLLLHSLEVERSPSVLQVLCPTYVLLAVVTCTTLFCTCWSLRHFFSIVCYIPSLSFSGIGTLLLFSIMTPV